MQKGLMMVGEMQGSFEHTNRVYDPRGLCPTIPTNGGGGHEPKMIEIVAANENNKVESLSRAEQSRAFAFGKLRRREQ